MSTGARDMRATTRSGVEHTLFTQLLVIGLCGTAVISAAYVRTILPARFLFDDLHLRRIVADPGVTPEDASFQTVAGFYRTLGLGHAEGLASSLPVLILVICVFLAVPLLEWARPTLLSFVVLGLTLVLGIVYLAQYTKEVLSSLVVLGALLALRCRSQLLRGVLLVSLSAGYGLIVRPYWLLIAALVPCCWLVLAKVRNPWAILALIFGVYLCLAVGTQMVQGQGLNATRAWTNLGRVDLDVGTLIEAPDLGSGVVGSAMAVFVVFVELLVPVPLFLGGGLYYIGSGLVIMFLWSIVAVALCRGDVRSDTGLRWMAALLLSLLIVQGVFEPDYGSYLKHLTPFLPVFLLFVPERTHALGSRESEPGAVGEVRSDAHPSRH